MNVTVAKKCLNPEPLDSQIHDSFYKIYLQWFCQFVAEWFRFIPLQIQLYVGAYPETAHRKVNGSPVPSEN